MDQVLAFRFLLAGAGMAVIAAATRQSARGISRRRLVALVAMGLTGYSAQAFAFIYALTSLPASLVELVLYTYPALVALAAWVVFRRRVTGAHAVALLASFGGVALLVGGVRLAAGSGLFFAAAAPLLYTAYILVGDYAMRGTPPLLAGAIVTCSAAVTFLAGTAVRGQLRPPAGATAWLLLFAIAAIPTMLALTTFLAGLPRVGAGRAALLSTWEPLVTVALAVVLLGDRFSALQALGGLLVLGSVAALQWPSRTPAQAEPGP